MKPHYISTDIEKFDIQQQANSPSPDVKKQIELAISDIDNILLKNNEKYKLLKSDQEYNKAFDDLLTESRPIIFNKYKDYIKNGEFAKAIENYASNLKDKIIAAKNNASSAETVSASSLGVHSYVTAAAQKASNDNIMTYDLIQNTAKLLDNNTLNDYKHGASFQKVIDYKVYFDKYDVQNNEALLTYMCVKTKLTNTDDMFDLQIMISKLSSVFYVSVIDTYITNTTDIFNKISDNIDDIIRKSGEIKIECPIYALIYQSPYLRYDGNEIKARYDVVNNLQSSYERKIDSRNNQPEFGMKPLYAKIIMMYPLYYDYNNSGKIVKYGDDSGLKFFQEYFNDSIMSRDKLCFLQCNQTNKIACGCLNRTLNSNADANSYKSTCIDEQNIPTNYGMMYSVNHKFAAFVSKIYLKETI